MEIWIYLYRHGLWVTVMKVISKGFELNNNLSLMEFYNIVWSFFGQ